MSFQPNDDLQRAKDALTIFRLWEFLGLPGVAPQRDGAGLKSPFREERTGSFSISQQGKVWCDFGTNEKGGVWEFIERARPQLDKGGVAKLLIEASGIIVARPSPAPAATPGAAVVDERLLKAAKAMDKREKRWAAENAVYEEREKQVEAPPARAVPAWPDFVEAHYMEGVRELRENAQRVKDLAVDRGWPVEWIYELIERGLIATPWERWTTPGAAYAKRQRAFVVQAPRIGNLDKIELEAVGYHQRFYVPARGNEAEKKGWLYVPSLPKVSPMSELERSLVAWAEKERGVTMEARQALVPPLPFVLGDIKAARLIVLLEGQWDAISFYGACGWFHDTAPAEGVAVFGIRGVQGVDAFLAHWGPWLEARRPRAWILADNDAAGGSWREAPEAVPGRPRPPSLSERLLAAGCRKTDVSWLKPGAWGKDFNDFYKYARPGPEKMFRWMRGVGVIDEKGGWA